MTTWSKVPPSEPGWYWCRLYGFGLWPVRVREGSVVIPDEFGPRIPSPEAISALEARLAAQEARIEAAKDALREAIPCLPDEARESVADRCRQALGNLEGRS